MKSKVTQSQYDEIFGAIRDSVLDGDFHDSFAGVLLDNELDKILSEDTFEELDDYWMHIEEDEEEDDDEESDDECEKTYTVKCMNCSWYSIDDDLEERVEDEIKNILSNYIEVINEEATDNEDKV